MNRDRYESLPEDLREVIDRNSGPDFAGEMGQVWLEAGRAGLAAARERGNGVDILAGDEAAKTRQALQQVVIRWMKEREDQRIDGLRLVKKARKAIGRHTAD
jgi:hypothetical protein